METIWISLAVLVVSVLSGALTAGVVMAIGGMGVLRAMHRRLVLAEERIEDTDDRISREVKRRAADKGVEARKTSAKAQAEEYLRDKPTPALGKPSVVERITR